MAEIVAGRKCCEENLATFTIFLPQQYNLSQFASFSSHNLYSKGSNTSPCLLIFWFFFATLDFFSRSSSFDNQNLDSYLPRILGYFLTQGKNQLLFSFQEEEGLCNSYLQGWDNEPKYAYFSLLLSFPLYPDREFPDLLEPGLIFSSGC